MRNFFVLFFCFFLHYSITAQIHEIGVFLGGSNFIGDVGDTKFIAPNEPAFGILYKWNKSPRHSLRFSYMQSTISGDDADSEVTGRREIGYSFENDIKEFSAGLEFNFFDFNLHEILERKITPYVYSGLSYTIYDGLFFGGGQPKSDASHSTVAIPMTVGIKSNLVKNFILGFEVGARYSFADDLDGSSPTNENLEHLKFGDVNSNDWYVFTGATLTYTFGEKPCYCKN